jgi:hypothetical protein
MKFLTALAVGYHRFLLILLLIAVALGSFAFGPLIGVVCSWACLVLVSLVWSPHR